MDQYLYYFYCNSYNNVFTRQRKCLYRKRPSQTHVLFRKATTSRPCLRKRRHPHFFKLTSSLFHFRNLCSFLLDSLQKDNAIHSKIPVVSISNRSSISLFDFLSFLAFSRQSRSDTQAIKKIAKLILS